jgi:uncharacterized protein (DUF433 family)
MSAQSVSTSHVELRPNRNGELRAYIMGTRVRVQDIVSDHERHGLSPEQIVREYPHLTLAQVHSALAYYFDHRDEMHRQMKEDDRYAQALEHEQRKSSSAGRDADANPVSS